MTRTKSRQRPAPRRTPRTSRKEVKTLIPGHARGAEAYLMMRRKGGRWAVLDSFRGGPAFVGAGVVWQELEPGTADGDLYRWTETEARALVARFVEQAVVIARNNSALDPAAEVIQTARRVESLAADMAPPEVMPQVLTLEQVAARMGKAHAAEPTAAEFTVPAAMDRPDWQPPSPDPAPELAPDVKLLGLKARRISVIAEDETVGLPLLRVHGPEVTAVLPVVAPPMPTVPPTVHLAHLAESSRGAGDAACASVADALKPDLVTH